MSVGFDLAGDVAVVTLDRPDRFNAIESTLGEGLISALERAGEEARAAILTGAGRAFCAGADLNELRPEYEDGGPDLAALLDHVFHPAVHQRRRCRSRDGPRLRL
jgi:2-(1,2-epoxy-1,2-dihydrophenyl)acetyl-CoA isomerase